MMASELEFGPSLLFEYEYLFKKGRANKISRIYKRHRNT